MSPEFLTKSKVLDIINNDLQCNFTDMFQIKDINSLVKNDKDFFIECLKKCDFIKLSDDNSKVTYDIPQGYINFIISNFPKKMEREGVIKALELVNLSYSRLYRKNWNWVLVTTEKESIICIMNSLKNLIVERTKIHYDFKYRNVLLDRIHDALKGLKDNSNISSSIDDKSFKSDQPKYYNKNVYYNKTKKNNNKKVYNERSIESEKPPVLKTPLKLADANIYWRKIGKESDAGSENSEKQIILNPEKIETSSIGSFGSKGSSTNKNQNFKNKNYGPKFGSEVSSINSSNGSNFYGGKKYKFNSDRSSGSSDFADYDFEDEVEIDYSTLKYSTTIRYKYSYQDMKKFLAKLYDNKYLEEAPKYEGMDKIDDDICYKEPKKLCVLDFLIDKFEKEEEKENNKKGNMDNAKGNDNAGGKKINPLVNMAKMLNKFDATPFGDKKFAMNINAPPFMPSSLKNTKAEGNKNEDKCTNNIPIGGLGSGTENKKEEEKDNAKEVAADK